MESTSIQWKDRHAILEKAGATIIVIPAQGKSLTLIALTPISPLGKLDLPSVLQALRDRGIKSLMVEGGARIIQSFLTCEPNIIDSLIVTVAPITVGEGVTHGIQLNYDSVSCPAPVLLIILTTT